MVPTKDIELRRYLEQVQEKDAILVSRVVVPGRFESEVTHRWGDIGEDDLAAVVQALFKFGSAQNRDPSYVVTAPSGGRGESLPGLWRVASVRPNLPEEPHGVYRVLRKGYATSVMDDEARVPASSQFKNLIDDAEAWEVMYPAIAPESLNAVEDAILTRGSMTSPVFGRTPVTGTLLLVGLKSMEIDDGSHEVTAAYTRVKATVQTSERGGADYYGYTRGTETKNNDTPADLPLPGSDSFDSSDSFAGTVSGGPLDYLENVTNTADNLGKYTISRERRYPILRIHGYSWKVYPADSFFYRMASVTRYYNLPNLPVIADDIAKYTQVSPSFTKNDFGLWDGTISILPDVSNSSSSDGQEFWKEGPTIHSDVDWFYRDSWYKRVTTITTYTRSYQTNSKGACARGWTWYEGDEIGVNEPSGKLRPLKGSKWERGRGGGILFTKVTKIEVAVTLVTAAEVFSDMHQVVGSV
jgi:hypothetical protein